MLKVWWPYGVGGALTLAVVFGVAHLPDLAAAANENEGLAAWAQLVGVMLALGATLIAAWLPVRHAQKADHEQQRRLLAGAVHVSTMVVGTIDSYLSVMGRDPSLLEPSMVQEQFDDVIAAFRDIPLTAADNAEVSRQLTLLRGHLRGARNAALDAYDNRGVAPLLVQQMAICRDWRDRAEPCRAALILLANEAGNRFATPEEERAAEALAGER